MLFLTYPFAGDLWLAYRLTYFAKTTLGQRIAIVNDWQAYLPDQDVVIISDPGAEVLSGTDSSQLVSLIRNPLSMLAAFSKGSKSLRSSPIESQETLFSTIDRMVAISRQANSQQIMTVRIEDFAAFPVVKLQAICTFLQKPCSIDLVRAFLDADRPLRRRLRSVYTRTDGEAKAKRFRENSRLEFPDQSVVDQYDLFSWVDHVAAGTSRAIVERYESFFEAFYPEVFRVCRGSEMARRVG